MDENENMWPILKFRFEIISQMPLKGDNWQNQAAGTKWIQLTNSSLCFLRVFWVSILEEFNVLQ